jgi:pSer/pThr/pTyr-binding forkhead associated (FHA) protein
MPERIATKPRTGSARTALALRFISGKYQGGEFPLQDGQQIVIGRSSDLDMVLVEEMVSRRHAKIVVEGGQITIEDLGSTNGTFVNGEKVQRAALREGDRVLIGTSILKVVSVAEAAARPTLEAVAAQREARRDEVPRMSGSLEEIPVPDLLQLFATSRKDGVLVLRDGARVGRIYLKGGVLQYAAIDGQPNMSAQKAAFRMLTWGKGMFELDPPDPRQFDQPLDLTAQEILMEGFRQHDELNALLEKLPAREARLTLRSPLEAPLHELEADHLDVLQLALNSPSMSALFDRSPKSDLQTAQIVQSLIRRGYLAAGS